MTKRKVNKPGKKYTYKEKNCTNMKTKRGSISTPGGEGLGKSPKSRRCNIHRRSNDHSAEILLIVWGILFVAARREGPTLKSRNFFKSARRGRERLVHEAGLLSEHIHGCGAGNRVGSNGGQSGALSAANPQISLPFSPFSEEENKIDHVGVEEEKGKQRELCLTGDAVPDTGKPGGGTVFGAPENTKPSCSEQVRRSNMFPVTWYRGCDILPLNFAPRIPSPQFPRQTKALHSF